jgi:hypothetical protein
VAEEEEMERDRIADLDKLSEAFFENLERESRCEYGGWGLDDKRPFGNSSVAEDILEIIGWEPEGEDPYDGRTTYSYAQKEYAHALYDDLGDHLRRRWKER